MKTCDAVVKCCGRRGRVGPVSRESPAARVSHRIAHAAAAGSEPRGVEPPVPVAKMLCLSRKKGSDTHRSFRRSVK
ncbi:hypothetical protein NDU88_001676 [Pleurodeles waltl]|uniref:Uncharacterized protein n=1 Tax=Pleurodeles waltl TaxID=8319 RepID=A0AAV7RAL8_PLEWA|nr:hypothetical protein NDU88_001676 [Pleurodeles waltl]